jgi:hypothetical protein
MRWLVMLGLLVVSLGCARKPEQSKLPNGEASGHEMPEPVDDSVIMKTDEEPKKPEPE